MRKLLITLIGGICFYTIASAQCDADAVKKIPGKWAVKYSPAISGATQYGLSSAQVPKLLAAMDNYLVPVKELKPQPTGMDIEWYKIIGFEPVIKNGPQPNIVQVYFHKFYCSGNKQYTDKSVAAEIFIESNYFFSFMTGRNTEKYYKGKEIMIMPYRLGTLQGYPYFEPQYEGSDVATHHHTVLLTVPGKLPYRVLTRREILEYMTLQLDTEKQKMLAYLDKTYKNDPQRKEEQKEKAELNYKSMYDRLNTVRKMYEKKLDSAAVLPGGNLHYGTIDDKWGFIEDKMKDDHICNAFCRHGTQFAVVNEDYFDKNLSKADPQFITITFNLTVTNGNNFRDPVYEQLKEEWKTRFDFKKLAMLLPANSKPNNIAVKSDIKKEEPAIMFNTNNGIEGVWMHLMGGNPRWKTFFSNGQIFEDIPREGFVGFDQDASKSNEYTKGYWGNYEYNNGSGTIMKPGVIFETKISFQKPGQIKLDNDFYYRCDAVDGLRLQGVWTSYADPSDPSLDKAGSKPLITFTKDGRFIDEGIFETFLDNTSPASVPKAAGSGTYEIKNFTLLLKYTDGHSKQVAFSGLLAADPVIRNDIIYLARSRFNKRN